ncbi:hypothetical protein FOZ63_021407 [Perkinsus olseni]|uniref:riboflavin kinase n=1 Tax=Perkinsus olseni TaxID=32597 RepID=A0A7J6RXA7_PEROL|nr:hypothetical protein FOZ63_021407 [Perkinsus olseni]
MPPSPTKEGIQRILHLLEPPARLAGTVASGFGRGSKLLGYPTANITSESPAVARFLETAETGVYLGFAQVRYPDGHPTPQADLEVHPTALSVGVNPSFDDVKEKLVEAYIMHEFSADFYGSELRLLVLGRFRPEYPFESIEQLKAEMKIDCDFTTQELSTDKLRKYREDALFRDDDTPTTVTPSNSGRKLCPVRELSAGMFYSLLWPLGLLDAATGTVFCDLSEAKPVYNSTAFGMMLRKQHSVATRFMEEYYEKSSYPP